jgi:hypothetical protein
VNRKALNFVGVVAFLGVAALPALADAPPAIPVEGVLTQANGSPVDGVVKLRLRLYADQNGQNALFEETFPAVSVHDGQFSLRLGDSAGPDKAAALLAIFAERSSVWLGIQVGADPDELSPRAAFATAPYAAFAQRCGDSKTLGGKALADITSAAAAGGNQTKWASFPVIVGTTGTTTGMFVSGAKSEGRFRRDGDTLDVTIQTVLTEKPTASGFWSWPLPAGYSIDTENALVVLGTGLAEQPGVGWHTCAVYASTPDGVNMYCDGSGGAVTSGNPWALDTGARFWLRYSVPIKQP